MPRWKWWPATECGPGEGFPLAVAVFFVVLFAAQKQVGQDSQDERTGNGTDFNLAKADDHATNTGNENHACYKQVFVLVQINILEHLKAGHCNKAVKRNTDFILTKGTTYQFLK